MALVDHQKSPLMWIAFDHSIEDGYVLDFLFTDHAAWQQSDAELFKERIRESARTVFREGAW